MLPFNKVIGPRFSIRGHVLFNCSGDLPLRSLCEDDAKSLTANLKTDCQERRFGSQFSVRETGCGKPSIANTSPCGEATGSFLGD
jgi:hypothetical protein